VSSREIEAKREAERKESETKRAALAAIEPAIKKSGFIVNALSDGSLEIAHSAQGSDFRGVLIIPAEIGGMPVTRIGRGAFERKVGDGNITSIIIPDTVTEIGEQAFNGAVGYSELSTITWGKGLKKIGAGAFSYNSKLKTINAGTGNSQTSVAANVVDENFTATWKSSGDMPRTYIKGSSGWNAK